MASNKIQEDPRVGNKFYSMVWIAIANIAGDKLL